MSAQSLLAVAALAITCALVCAAPATYRPVALSAALNHTVCPTVEDVDVNEDRIPKRIKVLKCALRGSEESEARAPSEPQYCGQQQGQECVQVYDSVLAYFPRGEDGAQLKVLDVPVGCSCLREGAWLAPRAVR